MGTEDRPGALITAAGLSSRMGEFKPLLPVGGVPLLEAGIRALRAGGVGPVYVVTGYRAADLRPLLARMDAVEIHNPRYAETDMFASVRLGLERAAADCGRLFLMPGDVALFRAYSVHAMDEAQREHDAGLVIPTCRETPGHPVLLGRDCIAHVLRHNGTMGLRGAHGLAGAVGHDAPLVLTWRRRVAHALRAVRQGMPLGCVRVDAAAGARLLGDEVGQSTVRHAAPPFQRFSSLRGRRGSPASGARGF